MDSEPRLSSPRCRGIHQCFDPLCKQQATNDRHFTAIDDRTRCIIDTDRPDGSCHAFHQWRRWRQRLGAGCLLRGLWAEMEAKQRPILTCIRPPNTVCLSVYSKYRSRSLLTIVMSFIFSFICLYILWWINVYITTNQLSHCTRRDTNRLCIYTVTLKRHLKSDFANAFNVSFSSNMSWLFYHIFCWLLYYQVGPAW